MNTPTATSISPKQVNLKWNPITSQADTGRDPVTYYRVDYLNRPCYADWTILCLSESLSLGAWVEVTSQSAQQATTTFVHNFPTVLKPDEIYYYRVCPMNGVGFGACSANFTFLSDNVP